MKRRGRDGPPAGAARREGALGPVLVFTTMVAAVVSSLGAPLVPAIARDLDIPLSAAQWSLTTALLTGAVIAPILGRLGDGKHRRRALIAGLAAVTLGGIVSALAQGLGWLLVGRALQGVGLGLVPLTIAAARAHLPPARAPGMIALLSVCAAAASGAGYPVTGLIAGAGGLSAAFWFGTAFSGLALVCVIAVVPRSAGGSDARLDIVGALLLAGGLVALLVAIAEGNPRGWTSPEIMALIGAAAVVLSVWVVHQLRARAPLVELRLLRRPAVMTGDVCAIVLGVAMYMYLSGVTAYVQTPRSAGYGFSASVLVAGLCVVPFSVLSITASRALPSVTRLVGAQRLLPLGSLVVALSGAFFAAFHSSLWHAFAMMGLLGVGLGFTFAAIPGLIVSAIPGAETGSAMGFYQVVRYIGFSLGSALVGAILASHTPAGQQLPTEDGYVVVLWVAAATCVAASGLSWVLRSRGEARARPEERLKEDAELGTAGLVGRTSE